MWLSTSSASAEQNQGHKGVMPGSEFRRGADTCHAGAVGCHAGATQWTLELSTTVAAAAARVPLPGSEKAHCIPSEKPSPCAG